MRPNTKLLFGVALLLAGCVNPAYDLNRIDSTATIGGEALTIPLGTIEKLTVADFLDEEAAEFLTTDSEGRYTIRMSDSWTYDGKMPDLSSYIGVSGMTSTWTSPLSATTVLFKQHQDYEVVPKSLVAPDLIRVTSMEMEELPIKLVVDIANFPALSAQQSIYTDFTVTFPERITPGTITVSEEFTSSHFEKVIGSIKAVDLTGINFKDSKSVVLTAAIEGSVGYKGGKPALSAIPVATVQIVMDNRAVINKLTGYMDYEVEETGYEMKFSDIPEALRNGTVVLDMTNPYILVDVNSNTGVAATGRLAVAGSEVSFPIQKLNDHTQNATTKIFIADQDVMRPEGYTYNKGSLNELLKDIPEKVDFRISGKADSSQEFVMVRDANYYLKADYQVVVPLIFGKAFKAEATYDMDITPEVASYLSSMALTLKGSVTNSLPLDLDLAIDFFGPAGEPVAMKTPVRTHINSCSASGAPATTAIEIPLEMAAGQDITISTAEATFKVTSGDASGIPVTTSSYIEASLQVALPGGITSKIL